MKLAPLLAGLLCLFAAAGARAQEPTTQTLCSGVALGANTTYRIPGTVDLQRFAGGSWLIVATFNDTTEAKAAVLDFQIEVIGPSDIASAWDTDNSNDRRDGFFCSARGDSSWLAQVDGSNHSVNVTPTSTTGPSYPRLVSSLHYASDDNSGAAQSTLVTPNFPASTTRSWSVPFADAFGNPQWYPGRVRLIAMNRSPSAAPIKGLTIYARGQRTH